MQKLPSTGSIDNIKVKKREPLEAVCLSGLLGVDLLLAWALQRNVPIGVSTPQYLTPAVEFATKHRITSDFLSIGYSALIGLGYRIAGSQTGLTVANCLISLLMIVAAWAFLRQIGMSVKATLALTTLLSLYPDFLLSYNKVQDTNLTALLLFGFLALLLMALRERKFGCVDLALSLLLGAAVLARPNLVLLIPLAWLVMWRARTPQIATRAMIHLAIIGGFYLVVTTVVHGRPFMPQNGPYNLYSGANQFTGEHIGNPEDSLVQAMATHGVDADVRWSRDPDTPGVNDLRDSKYKHRYDIWAWQFIRSHPGTAMKLSWLKLITFLGPDLHGHAAYSAAGAMKIFACLAIPLWGILLFVFQHPGPKAAKSLIVLTVATYMLPFILTVSSARFRVPLDFLLWMDIGAMIFARCASGFPWATASDRML